MSCRDLIGRLARDGYHGQDEAIVALDGHLAQAALQLRHSDEGVPA